MARTGQLTGGTDRLPRWTDASTTFAVTASCVTTAGGTTLIGIYQANGGNVPVITLTADLPYQPVAEIWDQRDRHPDARRPASGGDGFMISVRPSLVADHRAAGAAEFALVLPLLLIMLFGVIDGGRYAWEYNRAEKATQVGARMAVVTDVISTDLLNKTYVGDTIGGKTLAGGDTIPVGALGTITCTSASCSCAGACGGITNGRNAPAFTRLVTRMQQIKPDISAANVIVRYRGSGLGYAGDTSGMELSPLVTVELNGLQFRPITSLTLATIKCRPSQPR